MNWSSTMPVDGSPQRRRRERLGTTLRTHRGALVVGGVFLLLSLAYNAAVPAWEADNEPSHFNYVRYIVQHRALPTTGTPIDPPVMTDACRSGEEILLAEQTHQFRQPPLYYLLGAAATFWVDADTPGPTAANPFRFSDVNRMQYNFALHDPAREGFPYTGSILALHTLRLLSGMLGLMGLLATYLLGLLLFAGQRPLALAMMAINAFIPQYIYASAIVNNDILVAALGAWCGLLCAYAALRSPRVSTLFLAAVLAGLAITAKYSAIVLLPLVGVTAIAVLAHAWRANRRRLARMVLAMALVVGVAAIPVVVWLGRNKALYDGFLGDYGLVVWYVDYLLVGLPANSAPELWQALQYAFTTFWGQFAWDGLMLPPSWIVLLAVPCCLAAVGVTLYLLDRRQPGQMRWVVFIACLLVAGALLQSFVKAGELLEPRGRYLLPVLSAICFLLVLGLYRVLPSRFRLAGIAVTGGGLLVVAVAVLLFVLRPAYAPPPLEASAELRPGEQPLGVVFGDLAELVGYRVEPQRLAVGEPIGVTLVWKALQETPNNYVLSLHLLDGDKHPRARMISHPGHGAFPTSSWRPGDVFRDTYQLHWADTPWDRLPGAASLSIALLCPGSETLEETYVVAADSQGNTLGDAVHFGRVKISAQPPTAKALPAPPPAYTFGAELALEAYQLTPEKPGAGQPLTIEMRWRPLQPPRADYTVFAHLVDAQGTQLAGNDQPLTDGYYPSSLWEPGEVITHTHHLSLPALLPDGAYEIRIGVYEPVSGQRLPARDRADRPQQDDQVRVAAIRVPD